MNSIRMAEKYARKVIESTYIGTCSVIEHQKYIKQNGSTGFQDVVVLEDQPCKLSFKNVSSANNDEANSSIKQEIKLFVSPNVSIAPGSKIIVTQNDITIEYSRSGVSAMYATHQEIVLELFKGWS